MDGSLRGLRVCAAGPAPGPLTRITVHGPRPKASLKGRLDPGSPLRFLLLLTTRAANPVIAGP